MNANFFSNVILAQNMVILFEDVYKKSQRINIG